MAFAEAIFLDEGRGDVGGMVLDLLPVHTFFRYRVLEAGEVFFGVVVYGGVRRVEEPVPVR